MFDMIPFTSSRDYTPSKIWDPFQEFFGTVAHAAATDIRETDEAFIIETELPGFDKDELSVNMKEGVLTVRAEHKAEKKSEKKSDESYIRRERRYGSFTRSFDVTGIDESGITAAYENGVLALTLPKAKPVEPSKPMPFKTVLILTSKW